MKLDPDIATLIMRWHRSLKFSNRAASYLDWLHTTVSDAEHVTQCLEWAEDHVRRGDVERALTYIEDARATERCYSFAGIGPSDEIETALGIRRPLVECGKEGSTIDA